MQDKKKQWQFRWKNLLAPTKVPGVWERKEGGHLVRARVLDATTGHMKEIKKVMPEADLPTAFKWLSDERARIQAGVFVTPPRKMRFSEFVAFLVERKVNAGDIKSAKGRDRWKHTTEHLIFGTKGKKSGLQVPGFGRRRGSSPD